MHVTFHLGGGGDLAPLNILFLNDCLDIKSPLDLNLNMPLPTFALFVPRVKCVTVISQTISIIFIEVVIFVQDFQLSHDEGISMFYQGCARFAEILVSARYCEVCAR